MTDLEIIARFASEVSITAIALWLAFRERAERIQITERYLAHLEGEKKPPPD